MKLRKIFVTLLIILGVLGMTKVYAVTANLSLTGEDEATAGSKGSMYLYLSSDEDVCSITLSIDKENIDSITCSGENSWSIVAENEGMYQLLKAAGGKNENILKIEYVLSSEAENQAKISVTEIEAATAGLEDFEMTDKNKIITINKNESGDDPDTNVTLESIKIATEPTKTTYAVGEKFDKTGMKVIATYSDGSTKEITNYKYTPMENLTKDDTKVTISYTENGVTKVIEQTITVKDVTTSGGNLGNEGIETYVLPFTIITLIAIVSFMKLIKYKNI